MQLLYVRSYDKFLLSLHLLVSGCAVYVRRHNLQTAFTTVGYMLSVTASDSGMLFAVCVRIYSEGIPSYATCLRRLWFCRDGRWLEALN